MITENTSKRQSESKLITPESPLLVPPLLAEEIGLNEAIVLQQIYYFCSISKHIKDGQRCFWKTLKDWCKTLPFLSESSIRRAINSLKNKFQLISVKRHSAKTWYQANWFSINIDNLKKIWSGIHNEQLDLSILNTSKDSNSTTYSKESTSKSFASLSQEEKEEKSFSSKEENQESELHPWESPEPPIIIPEKTENSNQDKSSANSDKPKKRNNKKNRTEKYIWEVEIGVPKPLFLQWRADTHYEPQGGRWKTGKESCAFAEFYNNPEKTTAILYPEFGRWLARTADNTENLEASGMSKIILPSTFMPKAVVTEEVIRSAASKIKGVMSRGAEIMLPGVHAPGSQQSVPLSLLSDELPNILPGVEMEDWFIEEFVKQEIKFKLHPEKREEIEEWVLIFSDRVKITEEGLELFEQEIDNGVEKFLPSD